jgi:hypothetical protein
MAFAGAPVGVRERPPVGAEEVGPVDGVERVAGANVVGEAVGRAG